MRKFTIEVVEDGAMSWHATWLDEDGVPRGGGSGLSSDQAIGNLIVRIGRDPVDSEKLGIEVVHIKGRRPKLPGSMFGYYDPATGKETELTQEQISKL